MNNRGFTLVEVLSAVTIMVLIAIIAVPASMRFIEKGKNEQYNILESQIISGANKYYIKHKNVKCISLDKLVNEIDDKFIKEDKIIDPRNNAELKGIVEVKIEDKKTNYKLVSNSDTCKVPTLVAQHNWFAAGIDKSQITEINIVNSATSNITSNPDYSWPAAVDTNSDGLYEDDIMCYVNDNILTIVGNGSGKIKANENSSSMFSGFLSVTDITGLDLLDTSEVENMSSMFYNCVSLSHVNISGFDTSNVTSMFRMFMGCIKLSSIDISSFNTSEVENMNRMFYNCAQLETIYASEKFVTNNVTDSTLMFGRCENLSANETKYDSSQTDHTYARIDTSPENPGYFTRK